MRTDCACFFTAACGVYRLYPLEIYSKSRYCLIALFQPPMYHISIFLFLYFFEHNCTPSGKKSDWSAGGNCIPSARYQGRWLAILSCSYQTVKQIHWRYTPPGGEQAAKAVPPQTLTKRNPPTTHSVKAWLD